MCVCEGERERLGGGLRLIGVCLPLEPPSNPLDPTIPGFLPSMSEAQLDGAGCEGGWLCSMVGWGMARGMHGMGHSQNAATRVRDKPSLFVGTFVSHSSVPFFGLPISCVGLAVLWSIMVRGHLPLGLGSFGLPLSAGREVG